MTDCALCQLAATRFDKRLTCTFRQLCVENGCIEVVRDTHLGKAPDRLLGYYTRHGKVGVKLQLEIRDQLADVANGLWGADNWTFETPRRGRPQHGWHCHARKTS